LKQEVATASLTDLLLDLVPEW